MGLKVDGLEKRFSATRALSGVSFEVPDGKLLSILGPSGSGKTTLLRCIAGVEKPESGSVMIGSKVVFDSSTGVNVPPEQRGIGMVFQSNALWPHMTVRKNVAYPLEIRGDKQIDARVSEVLSMLKIESLADRLPSQISGGEQQRVAIARAIVYNPALVLLDEPFSSLDVLLREALRDELRQLQLSLGMAMVYVTHDRVDALSVGDEIAVMSEGKVKAIGTPQSLLSSPPNSYTARFLGGMLAVEGRARAGGPGSTAVSTNFGELELPGSHDDGRVMVCIPPSACRIVDGDQSGVIQGTVAGEVTYPSGRHAFRVATYFGTVEVFAPGDGGRARLGMAVSIAVDPSKCILVSD